MSGIPKIAVSNLEYVTYLSLETSSVVDRMCVCVFVCVCVCV